MKKKLVLLVAIVFATIIYFDITQYLQLDFIKQQQNQLEQLYQQNPVVYIFIFFLCYVLTTALSIPGATLLTLLAGALFGVALGTVLVSFASTLGATIAFLGSRWILRQFVQTRFSKYLTPFNSGVEKDGALYLFTLRLTPVVPFFVVNLVMGLTTMRSYTFYFVSQLGMLPATIVYVNAGTQLATIKNLNDIVSAKIILSLMALGLFPIIMKKVLDLLKKKSVYKKYKKPKKYDYNLVVIGAGAAGLVTSYIASAAKAKVALIEKHKMGGDCLNTGCIPSKSFIRSAKLLSDIKRSSEFGIKKITADFDFSDVMLRVQRVIKTIEPHDSIERYSNLGVDCHTGTATIINPWTVDINGLRLTTKNIVVASGARPLIPNIPGLRDIDPMTSDTLWNLRDLPKKLLVLGAGPIGLELAQSFARYGTQVTLIEKADRLLAKEDREVTEWITKKLKSENLVIHTNSEVTQFKKDSTGIVYSYTANNITHEATCDAVLVAAGRKPNTDGFGLKELGIVLKENGAVSVNEKLQTNFSNIYACGDVTGMYQFTHTASHQAWFAAVNSMISPFYSFNANYDVVPWCIYTDPEIARVGLNETDVIAKNIAHKVTFFNTDHMDRALTEESAYGFIKIITAGSTDKILGVTIVGLHAGECLAEFVLAMKHGLGLNKVLQTIHTYPTLTEANKMAAGQWKKTQITQKLLKYSECFNLWQRR